MYDIKLGKIDLYGLMSVDENNSRDITIYDGIGKGKFPRAENRNLKTYNMNFELSEYREYSRYSDFTRAKRVFRELDKLLNSARPSRLIVNGEGYRLSVKVLLESYSKQEKSAGIYDVSVKCIKYVSARVRTTGIPQIIREGKIPTPPPQPMRVSNVYNTTKQITGKPPISPLDNKYSWVTDRLYFLRKDNEVYEGFVPSDKPIKMKFATGVNDNWETTYTEGMGVSTIREDSPLVKGAKNVLGGIANFWGNYWAKDKKEL